MSTSNTAIASRLLEIRTKLNYPQSRVAAQLDIADRSYKNYELGKRDLPIHVALKFCELYEVDLNWLVYGKTADTNEAILQRVGETVEAISSHYMQNQDDYSPEKSYKVGAYIFKQSAEKGTKPKLEAKEYFSTT